MGFFKDLYRGITGKTAADAARDASTTAAQAQREQLEYLKEVNKLPQEIKEQSLTQLSRLYGTSGDYGQKEKALAMLMDSPIYKSILASRSAGEEAILRHAGATGTLRGSTARDALAKYNIELEQAALASGVSGLQGLAGLGTNEQQIGQTIANIGATQAQGITAAAQSQQKGSQNVLDTAFRLAELFI